MQTLTQATNIVGNEISLIVMRTLVQLTLADARKAPEDVADSN